MKLDALDHPKTLDFASRLGVELPTAIGHLELLWAFVAKQSPQGNLGKWPDGAIARACYWMGDPEAFLNCLLKSGLVDVHKTHRLVIHDWSEHCPNWVRAKLKRTSTVFISTEVPTEDATEDGSTDGNREASTRGRVPSHALPSLGMPNQAAADAADSFNLISAIKLEYPKGLQRGDHWILAERATAKLIDAGEPPESLIVAAKCYREQQEACGNIGTNEILRPHNFFANDAWRGPFPLPTQKPKTNGYSPTAKLTWVPKE